MEPVRVRPAPATRARASPGPAQVPAGQALNVAVQVFPTKAVPYATYLGANALNASGVLAVIACGLYLSRKSSHFFSPSVRIQANAVWESLTFVLNGLVFVLIGLQLPYVLAA